MSLDFDRIAGHRTIELTTTGRVTAAPRRIEIWWFRVGGRFVITGTPGRRDWLANVLANPEVLIHVGGEDIAARALPITDHAFRRRVFTSPDTSWYTSEAELDRLVGTAPMVEILFDA
jgi:deazaflavin-dependent oxidoreductase (nitroreductase family)